MTPPDAEQYPGFEQEEEVPSRFHALREYAKSIGLALGVALVLRFFFVEAFALPVGNSNLLYDVAPDDHVFVLKPIYLFSPPSRGDVLLFSRAGEHYFSRVLGLPGERIDVSSAGTRVDGTLLPEPYVLVRGTTSYSLIVPERHVFVMADNRAAPQAGSTYWGAIPYDEIVGKFWVRWWPWRRIGRIKLPEQP